MASYYCANCNQPMTQYNGCAECAKRMLDHSQRSPESKQAVIEGMNAAQGVQSMYSTIHCLLGLYALYLFFTGHRWSGVTIVDLAIVCCCPYIFVILHWVGKTKKFE